MICPVSRMALLNLLRGDLFISPSAKTVFPQGTVSSLLCLGLSTPFSWSQKNGVQILTLTFQPYVKVTSPSGLSISSIK